MSTIFGYDSSDARFIGNPVDYIIFDRYTAVRERMQDKTTQLDWTYIGPIYLKKATTQ